MKSIYMIGKFPPSVLNRFDLPPLPKTRPAPDVPKVGSWWKTKDLKKLPVACPTEFMVHRIDFARGQHTVVCLVGSFEYYFDLYNVYEYFDEVTDEDDIGWMMLRNVP